MADPVFDPPGGEVGIDQNQMLVTLTTTTPGAQTRHTVGNVAPTRVEGTLYDGPSDLYQFQSFQLTVNAIAFRDGWQDSTVVRETYVVPTLARRAVG